jgi:hypothetical protein
LKDLAHSLMAQAKESGGGLEVEVLESVEPPAAGLTALRNTLLGDNWRLPEHNGKRASRLTIPRDQVRAHFNAIAEHVVHQPLAMTPLYRALREARKMGVEGDRTGLSGADALRTVRESLEASAKQSGSAAFPLSSNALLPNATDHAETLRLHFLLQQRDYVKASLPFVEALTTAKSKGAKP